MTTNVKGKDLMRMIGFAAFAAAVISVTASRPLTAQDVPQDNAAVITAAVTDLLHLLRTSDGVPAGTIGYDPRPLERRVSDQPGYPSPVAFYVLGERENAVSAGAWGALNARVGNLETSRVCADANPRSCRLRDAVAVFATSDPTVHGDSAEVVVKALWMGNLAKQPVQEGIFRITLRRVDTCWRVATTETLVIS